MRRMARLLVAGGAALLVLALVVIGFHFLLTPRLAAQPLFFNHQIHAGVVKLDCLFCHRNADKGAAATVPPVEFCMACHSVVATTNPQVQKVRQAWEKQQPILWTRLHRVPDHVHFVHVSHINAGIDCATCHGDVASMQQVKQVKALKMGDCVGCHRARNAPTECGYCHY